MNENIIFLSEMQFSGKIPSTHNNMRTEFAWMNALNAQHENIREYQYVSGYEHVYVIFPKGKLSLSAEGSTISDIQNPISDLLNSDLVDQIRMFIIYKKARVGGLMIIAFLIRYLFITY